MLRCLIVDDDAEIRTGVLNYLRGFGIEGVAVADGAGLRRAITADTFDVVVLDVMLPDENGLDLCRWLRGRSQAAVVMLTALGDATSRVLGLEIGADDYLAKPFEPRELVARIKAVLRRGRQRGREEPGEAPVHFAGWRFDRLRRQLVSGAGVVSPLSAAEFRLLHAFVDHPGRVLGRERLIELTRAPGVEVNDRSVDLAVSRLRAKLGDNPREPQLIRTVRGEGYLFDAQPSR